MSARTSKVAVKVAREGNLLVFPLYDTADVSSDIAQVARHALEFAPEQRPTFQEIVTTLQVCTCLCMTS